MGASSIAMKISDENEYGGLEGLLRLFPDESTEEPFPSPSLGGVSKMPPLTSLVGDTGGTVGDTSNPFKISLFCSQLRLVKSSSGSPFSVLIAPKQLELKFTLVLSLIKVFKFEPTCDLLRYGLEWALGLSKSVLRIGGIVNPEIQTIVFHHDRPQWYDFQRCPRLQ